MSENLGKKSVLIVALTLAALACIAGPWLFGAKPFRLGLDLQGGTRLVYRFDFEKAVQQGVLTKADLTRKGDLLLEFAEIIRGRVDPKGVMELSLRPEGEDRIVIELPGAADQAASQVYATLAKPLGADPDAPEGRTIELVVDPSKPGDIKAFPQSGGSIRIGSEKIVYKSRSGAVLSVAKRGSESTTISAHAAGDQLELLTSDEIQRRIENVGDMQFLLEAKAADVTALGSDLSIEQKRVEDWRKANPTVSIDDYNRLAPDKGGPVAGLRWYSRRLARDEAEVDAASRPVVPLIVPRPKDPALPQDAWVFTGSDLDSVGLTQDDLGYPAVAFEMSTEKRTAFGDFTGGHVDDNMAIILNGEIATIATIRSKLPGGGRIDGGRGGFTSKEVSDLISVLRSGSLRIKPELQDKSRVGASLGDDYVKKGALSMAAALLVIVGFMLYFYRKLGWYSVIGLVINLVLLLGMLAMARATLTLPGVAGVILTLGMAVDGNILIYERLREEMTRGLKLVQAVKASFERAAVTIIDSNLTTLIAGVILYFVGTGPIRGFATTLDAGILSTLFTVIVVTEVLVMREVKRGAKTFHMKHVLVNPGLDFMGMAKYAIAGSVLVTVAGLALFAWLPDREKLGIDFLGGFTVTARTQEPQAEKTIRDLVGQIPGTVWKSAAIQPITDSGDRTRGYTTFRITFKLEGENTAVEGGGETGKREIEKALAPVLQRGPIVVSKPNAEAPLAVQGEVYLEDEHADADVQQTLEAAGVGKVTIARMEGRAHAFTFTGEVAEGKSIDDLRSAIHGGFEGKDSKRIPYRLMTPLPEESFIGAQVGGELRDKAVLAVILSLLGTIMYLRVRFAEYSYGIAVVVSLLHDVLIAVGALAFATWTGMLQAELDLSMIAAFLTIIGYSQNDTIVIFDRVRENLPKSNKPLSQVLNDSINECFGRTILTTSTVVLTLLVLFLFNVGTRNVLEGFSYCMLVGVISGAYSTVYVASPVLLWLENRSAKKGGRGIARASGAKAPPSPAAPAAT